MVSFRQYRFLTWFHRVASYLVVGVAYAATFGFLEKNRYIPLLLAPIFYWFILRQMSDSVESSFTPRFYVGKKVFFLDLVDRFSGASQCPTQKDDKSLKTRQKLEIELQIFVIMMAIFGMIYPWLPIYNDREEFDLGLFGEGFWSSLAMMAGYFFAFFGLAGLLSLNRSLEEKAAKIRLSVDLMLLIFGLLIFSFFLYRGLRLFWL